MIIDDNALKAATKKDGFFVIKTVISNVGWSGCMKNLWIEILKTLDNKNNYNVYEYKYIRVYVHKSLIIDKDNLYIYEKSKSPLLGSAFGVKGVTFQI